MLDLTHMCSLYKRIGPLCIAQCQRTTHHLQRKNYQSSRCPAGVRYDHSLDATLFADPGCSRELLMEGATGGLIIFEDRPNYWDAWGERLPVLPSS